MQISLIAQTQVCPLDNAKINFYLNFDHYDLTNGMPLTLLIWYNIPTSSLVQDPMVEGTKKGLKNDSYLYLCKGIVFI